ncbi:hypothetical protein [Mycolicibacter algericus]|uniref:Uncharacterized protein n=1 Tax=Mycolicibacter algericus TaxID=1288388 RepID=A0A7I9Y7C0_MYCAL|nr:hypothetical protein [Mycolicibacter algericus]GFG84566.1 hypothetical protein MALGJ_12420 [Mycolicibacter algericus]
MTISDQLDRITEAVALWRANDRGAGPAIIALGCAADMRIALRLAGAVRNTYGQGADQ